VAAQQADLPGVQHLVVGAPQQRPPSFAKAQEHLGVQKTAARP
jgi:hypothetical protein